MFTFVFEWQVLMPLLAEVSFNAGPREFGLLSAAAGIGSLIGAVTTAHGNKHPGMRRLGVFSLLVGGSMVLVALAPTLDIAYLTMVPLGYAAMVFMINGNTMLQLNAVPQARGRVMALYGIVFLGSTPIGAPIAGWIGQVLGPRAEFALMGALAGAIGVVVLVMRKRRSTVKVEPEAELEPAPGAAAIPAR
jgi:MFS family permease